MQDTYQRLSRADKRQAKYDDEHRRKLLSEIAPHLADDERAFLDGIKGKGEHLQFAEKTWLREWGLDREWTDAMDDYRRLLDYRLDAILENRIPHEQTVPTSAGFYAQIIARGD